MPDFTLVPSLKELFGAAVLSVLASLLFCQGDAFAGIVAFCVIYLAGTCAKFVRDFQRYHRTHSLRRHGHRPD